MPKIVKQVRRHGETYDIVRTDDGKHVKRPVDVAPKRPAPRAQEKPRADVSPTTSTQDPAA